MQRQKTIAKWLAVILILTAIIATYLTFELMSKNKTKPAAGIAGAENAGDVLPEVPTPVFSTFPRECERIDNVCVAHIGGDEDETYLSTVLFAGKRIMFFESESKQFDVREKGVHMAIFSGSTLEEVRLLTKGEFVAANIVQNGLLTVTKNDNKTVLNLFGCDLVPIGENSFDAYSSYKLLISGLSAKLYAVGGGKIYQMTITQGLEISRSAFFLPVGDTTIITAFKIGDVDNIYLQKENGILTLTFDQNRGFSLKSEIENCEFCNFVPVMSDGEQTIVMLAKCGGGEILLSLDKNGFVQKRKEIEGASGGVIFACGGNILHLVGDKKYSYCSHLELLSVEDLTFSFVAGGDEDLTYFVSQGGGKIALQAGEKFFLAELEGNRLSCEFESIGMVKDILPSGGIFFSAGGGGKYTYMCFGGRDIFYIPAPVDNSRAV